MSTLFRIARKEFGAFFSSPVAFIFLGTFLATTLFIFFWVETFFSRNITELRALFEWMPILLIFLVAAITMRMWAEEHRAGTLEFLLTSPVRPVTLVLGKFLACLALISLALLMTLPLAITVSFLGPLDWGPVLGGYLASLFLAAAYISIGLFVSVKSENQIVSLITTSLICGLLYLIGSDTLAAFFGNKGAEILQLLGSGSRFHSITRGVIDLRDLYYYLGIMGVFLCLNIYGLEKIRWAGNPVNSNHRAWQIACGLLIANFLAANLWLAPMGELRSDMTDGDIYSISDATRSYLEQIREPLLIRGYFSAQTHPLLAPLVPRLRDLLEEYAIAGKDKVRVEFIDPADNPDLEQEAGQKYGIRPVPFQTASKYQASVTNSYFDILIRYGDQFETLGFRDLIEVKAQDEQNLDVELRNPEYDITRAIKKVLYSYQAGGDLFSSMKKPVALTGYFSADERLPEELVKVKGDLLELSKELEAESGGRFSATLIDPEANNGAVADQISREYGFRPMAASLFDQNTFWFYMMLQSGDQTVEVPLPEDFEKESLKRAIDAGLKRFATGFTKNIALSVPKSMPPMPQYGIPGGDGPKFDALRELLSQEHTVTDAALEKGQVPGEADILMVAAPQELDEKKLFAVDQFLMQGGTVILAASPYQVDLKGQLSMSEKKTGLEDWLQHNGISIEKQMVLDPQNTPFPVPVQRNLGGFMVRETKLVNYPYFVDIRPDGMNEDSGITSGLQQVTMNWVSPITIDKEKNKGRKVIRLLESTDKSWLSSSTMIQPDFQTNGDLGFAVEGEQGKHLLAAAIEGGFTSYFTGKPSPLLKKDEEEKEPQQTPPGQEEEKKKEELIIRQLDKSPDTARIILFGSNSFLSDTVLGIASSVMRTNYLGPVQLVANTVDWSLEDRGLLSIRGRSHFSRPLNPITKNQQLFWEYLNYGLVLLGLVIIWLLRFRIRKRAEERQLAFLQPETGRVSS
ncbi:MAG: Gldg family protein [Candidatus Electrothrix aestuarii]|uniref:Gldg family protein n=1 Tax=Candidatus Electrothrix aestuarii TaxID=3062594 RepID=A0AAU8LTE3_9BACT|nr:Gldg family protein [Candidatus Electrothrix aestuarii]